MSCLLYDHAALQKAGVMLRRLRAVLDETKCRGMLVSCLGNSISKTEYAIYLRTTPFTKLLRALRQGGVCQKAWRMTNNIFQVRWQRCDDTVVCNYHDQQGKGAVLALTEIRAVPQRSTVSSTRFGCLKGYQH